MRELLFLLSSFLHDLATGFWLASFFLFLYAQGRGLDRDLAEFFSKLLSYSLIFVILTGILRVKVQKVEDFSPIKRRFLLIKHALLIPLLLVLTLWVWSR